jgi:hypothetical protein
VVIGTDQLLGDVGVFLWFNHRHHFSNRYMGTGECPEGGHVEANDDQQQDGQNDAQVFGFHGISPIYL